MTRALLLLMLVLSGSLNAASQEANGKYDTLIQQGNSQLQAGKPDQALSLGQQAEKLAPERWQAYALMGGALMNSKRYEEAADQFSEGIRLAPETKKLQLRDLRKQCVMAESGVSSTVNAPNPPSNLPSMTAAQAEVVLWKTIESSTSESDFQGYLSRYPNGAFATLAKTHLDELRAEDAKRQQQAEDLRKQQAEIAEQKFNAGTSFIVNYEGLITNSIAEGKLTITPNGVVYSGEGKPPHHAFSASCADLTWSPGRGGIVKFQIKSTNAKIALFPRLDGDAQGALLNSLKNYCGDRS